VVLNFCSFIQLAKFFEQLMVTMWTSTWRVSTI